MKAILLEIAIVIIAIILVIGVFIWLYKQLTKKYLSKEDYQDKPISYIRTVIFGFILYAASILCYFLSYSTLGGVLITMGLPLVIYGFQSLESYRTSALIEKRIGKKIQEIDKNDLKALISQVAGKEIARLIDVTKIEQEIISQVQSNIKEN